MDVTARSTLKDGYSSESKSNRDLNIYKSDFLKLALIII